jgi:hypothetical protein
MLFLSWIYISSLVTVLTVLIRGCMQTIPDWICKIHKHHPLTPVKTAHVHPGTCNLAHWLTRHGSPTIYRYFALPQLLYRWRHQSGIFWIHPLIVQWTLRSWMHFGYYKFKTFCRQQNLNISVIECLIEDL